jgi:ketosteroid isomerase-like protein
VSVKENSHLIDGMVTSLNARDWNKFSERFAKSVLVYEPGAEPSRGSEAIVESFQVFVSAFPDAQVTKVRSFGESDWICVEVVFQGTNKGPLTFSDGKTIRPTNKAARVEIAVVAEIQDGKITAYHEYWDRLGMFAQLGLG